MIKTIDLFAGCGGLSVGFHKAGFLVDTAVEYDKQIAASFIQNHPGTRMIIDDIKNVDNEQIFSHRCADVIIGGPPCQGFSMAGARIRKNAFLDDPRNHLFKHYFNIVRIVDPKVFVIENVKGIATLQGGAILNEIKRLFEDPDNFNGKPYKVQYRIVRAKELGIPQDRERMIIFGTKADIDIDEEFKKTKQEIRLSLPNFFEATTVWDAISNLPSPTEDGYIKQLKPQTAYQRFLSDSAETYNHTASKHKESIRARMKRIKPDENFTQLNESINSIHSGSYGRLNPNKTAPTITTRFDTPSGGRFTHPYEDRTLTPREAARIQSFPDSFKFVGTKSSICKQIGNAVPPKLAYFLAITIRRIINENK